MEDQSNSFSVENQVKEEGKPMYAPGSNLIDEPLYLSEETEKHLISIANWGTFLAILSCLGVAFLFLVGLSMFAAGSMADALTMGLSGSVVKWMALFYILVGVIYLIPCIFMFKYSSKVKNAIRITRSQQELDEGMRCLKNTFKYLGIMVIVSIVLSIAVFFLVLSTAMNSLSSLRDFDAFL